MRNYFRIRVGVFFFNFNGLVDLLFVFSKKKLTEAELSIDVLNLRYFSIDFLIT